jgi:hypothetical protein
LLVIAVLGLALGAWGNVLGGVVSAPSASAIATPQPSFGIQRTFVGSVDGAASINSGATCIYGQSSQGMLVIISARTGSLLSEGQAANCSK